MSVSQGLAGLIVTSRTHHAAASRDITAQSAFELGFDKRSHRMSGEAGRGLTGNSVDRILSGSGAVRQRRKNALLGSTFPRLKLGGNREQENEKRAGVDSLRSV
jgi:hypothetical protein